ncbi:hypothetical protein DPEC_G00008850, partial [Dallia pectoralis]
MADNSERGSSHFDDSGERFETNFPEGLCLSQSLEEDQKRRDAIEKWVNGEYGNEPTHSGQDSGEELPPQQGLKLNNGEEEPPEGVYMVQPKGCSDEEDNAPDEPEPVVTSRDASYQDNKDTEDGPHMPLKSESISRQAPLSSSGETTVLQDYAANTMTEFLGMFGYDDQQVKDELAKKINT